MSEQQRDEGGEYAEKVTDQDVLKVFDFADEPVLTASEVAAELPITREAAGCRLNRMREDGLVDRKKTGARAVAWWAEVALRLSPEARKRADAADPENGLSQAEMKRRLGMDG
jgi:predicted transcriptional regulator